MINYNLIKFKNLAKYLKIEKIDENNYDEVVDKFFVIPYKHTDPSESTMCFCGRHLKYYYYLINKTNNDVLIAGSGCKNIFETNTRHFNDREFKKYFNLNFKRGIFSKIVDWNLYLESCINQYLIDIDNVEFDDLLDKYKNNNFIVDTINNARKKFRIEQQVYNNEIMKQKERVQQKIKEANREIVVYDIIRENTYCKIIF